MAAPVDAGRLATSVSTAASPVVINLPGSIAVGDLLIMCLRLAVASTSGAPTGWTSLQNNEQSDASTNRTGIYYRVADGTEGSTVSVSVVSATKAAAVVYRITGAENPATQAPQFSTVAIGTTTANTCNPGNVAPTGGSKDYLFIVFGGYDGETGAFTGAPTNYTNLTPGNSGTAGAVTTNCIVGTASRQLTAASEDPGAFTHGAANAGWTAYTIAIHPPAASGATGPQDYRQYLKRWAHRFLRVR